MARIFPTIAIFLLSSFAVAQQKTEKQAPPPQSPRQALIEMVRGGGTAFYKHLTVEMQQSLQKTAKAYLTAAMAPKPAAQPEGSSSTEEKVVPEFQTEVHTEIHQADADGMGFDLGYFSWAGPGNKNLQAFDSGPVLFTYTDPSTKEKMEIRVENDDLRGTEDDMQLSAHLFKDGQEQSIPFLQSFTVGLKMQEGVWRVNEISAEVKATVGDPKFLEDMKKAFESEARPASTHVAATQPKEEEHPAVPIPSTMRALAVGENLFAYQHPDLGFTCNLSDMAGDKLPSFYTDPQIATGIYNGYHFSISGCGSRPSEVFHLVAEPLTPGGKAYCINSTQILRFSEDGRGSTCLAAGQPVPE